MDLANERPLEQLKGKHVFRLRPKDGDRSYMEDCIKIIHTSPIGEILYEDNDRFLNREGEIRLLRSVWNDQHWRLVTPTKNGKGFFENICTVLEPSIQKQAFILVKKIFATLEDDCHLSEKAPFDSLREYCIKKKKGDLLMEVEALEKLVGPLSVTILAKGTLGSDDTLRSML